MQERRKTIYKVSADDEKEIKARLKSLLEICQICRVPMFASVALANSETETQYENIVYGGQSHIVTLTDDKIRKHMLISNGFEAVPARDVVSIDMNEVMDFD